MCNPSSTKSQTTLKETIPAVFRTYQMNEQTACLRYHAAVLTLRQLFLFCNSLLLHSSLTFLCFFAFLLFCFTLITSTTNARWVSSAVGFSRGPEKGKHRICGSKAKKKTSHLLQPFECEVSRPLSSLALLAISLFLHRCCCSFRLQSFLQYLSFSPEV